MPRKKYAKGDQETEFNPSPVLPIETAAIVPEPKPRRRRATKIALQPDPQPLSTPLVPTLSPELEARPVIIPEVAVEDPTIAQVKALRQQLHEALEMLERFPAVIQQLHGEAGKQQEQFRKEVEETRPLFQDLVQQAKAVQQQHIKVLQGLADAREPLQQLKEAAQTSQQHLLGADGQMRELVGQAKECSLRLGEVLPRLSETERRFEGVEQSSDAMRQELDLLRKQTEQARSELQGLREGTQEAVRELAQVQRASREAIQSLLPLKPLREELDGMRQEIQGLLGQGRECGQRLREVLPHLPKAAQEIEALREATSATRLEVEAVRQETLETGASVALILTQVQDRELQVETSPAQEKREPNHLGVTVDPVVVVAEVLTGTPAAETDIAPGDVVESINGQKVTNGSELRAAVQQALAGEQLTLRFSRGGISRETLIWIAPHATDAEQGEVHNRLGITVDSAVLVVEVQSASLAETAGLLPGDVIREMDGIEITSGEQLRQAFLDAGEQTEVSLGVSRGSESRQVVVRFPEPEAAPVLAGTETARAEPPF